MTNRYAYRLKGAGNVTLDYAAKAPATSALYTHIRYGRGQRENLSDKDVKRVAKEEYELVTYALVEESHLQSLQRDSNWLSILEEAGIDNSEAYSYAYDVKRDAIAEGRFTEEDFD